MADLPPNTSFRKQDFPATGLGSQDVLDKLFLPLNAFLKAVRDALNGQLSSDNMLAEYKEISLTTPSSGTGVLSCFPLNFKPARVTTVKAVDLVGCLDTAPNPGVPSLGVPSWLRNGDGTVKITNIPGLLLGRTYKITLRISGG